MSNNTRLGSAVDTTGRVVAVLDELVDSAIGRGQVALDELGAAVMAPLGPDGFDDEEPDDRTVLVEVLQALAPMLGARGWALSPLAATPPAEALVSFRARARAPAPYSQSWHSLGLDVARVGRWAYRARRRDDPAVPFVDPRPRVAPPTLPVREGTTVTGCVRARLRNPSIPCAPAEGGRLVCPTCRGVTVLAEPMIGPRLPLCECAGPDEAVCAHPVPWPTARRASPASVSAEGR